jgi:hypothetical protein
MESSARDVRHPRRQVFCLQAPIAATSSKATPGEQPVLVDSGYFISLARESFQISRFVFVFSDATIENVLHSRRFFHVECMSIFPPENSFKGISAPSQLITLSENRISILGQ